ncbi:hypothetical protein [Legionella spiritensis]|uniref:hypothetical protein n=1 Tax=Legionella spiritensis TaxID=452 RepID=UPI000F6F6B65|nr:hypothetical protein [Legionella spiritensis]VEG91985.1 VipA [Legionella spiritensis]
MAVSKEFMELFSDFTERYKIQGKGGAYLKWGKDEHFDELRKSLQSLLDIVQTNADAFHDHSLIQYLCVTATLYLPTDPVFSAHVSQLLNEYYKKCGHEMNNLLSHALHISVEPEPLRFDLVAHLNTTIELLKKAHQSEIKSLQAQMTQLRREKDIHEKENERLKTIERESQQSREQRSRDLKAHNLLRQLNEIMGITTTDLPRTDFTPEAPVIASPHMKSVKETPPLAARTPENPKHIIPSHLARPATIPKAPEPPSSTVTKNSPSEWPSDVSEEHRQAPGFFKELLARRQEIMEKSKKNTTTKPEPATVTGKKKSPDHTYPPSPN